MSNTVPSGLSAPDILSALAQRTSCPSLLVTEEGTIVAANERVFVEFEYSEKDLVGQPLQFLVPDLANAIRTQPLSAPLDGSVGCGDGAPGIRASVRTRSGAGVTVELLVSPSPARKAHSLVLLRVLPPGAGSDDELRYRLAVDAARIGAWEWDARTDILILDGRSRELLGVEQPVRRSSLEMLGRRIHEDDRQFVVAALRRAAGDAEGHFEAGFRVVRPDGELRWVRAVGRMHFERESGVARPFRILGTVVDVTDQESARRDAERSRERAASLQSLTAALAATYTPEEVAEVVVAQGMAATGALTGLLMLRDQHSPHEIVILREAGVLERLGIEASGPIPVTVPGPAAECIRTGRPAFMESRQVVLERFPGMSEIWERLGTHASATVPLIVGTESVGSMSFTFGVARRFSEQDRSFFESLGAQAAQALERARLLEAERVSRAEMETLNGNLRRALAELQAVLDVVPIGIGISSDAECSNIRVNPAFAVQLGISPDRNASKSGENGSSLPFRIMRNGVEVSPGELPMQRAAAEARAVADVEFEVVHDDGRVVRLLEYASPLFDSSGNVRGAVGAFIDISEINRLIEAERRARDEAERANRAKSEFLAVMSHELRTPLNAIGGYAELLSMGIRGPVTEHQREDLDRLRRSQKHLLGLIDELLNYARVETGSLRLTLREVRVQDALSSVETLILPQLRAKNFALEVMPCDSGMIVCADEEKLQQILLNLLSNSSKFTSAGGTIRMSASRAEDSLGRAVAEIRVADNGIGIPAEHLESIFQPFVQVGRALNHPVEGTGLGLAISRDLARSMSGELVARSELGVGSEFVLSLPIA